MPEAPAVLGFSGRWYPDCVRTAEPIGLPSGRTALVAAPAPLLASKLEAYLDRGAHDPLLSVDLDDIASLCLGCARLEESLASSPPALRGFVESTLSSLVADPRVLDAITSNLLADDPGRAAGVRVIEVLRTLASRG